MKNTPNPPTKTAKFIYVPKNKGESSSKENADLKSISVHPNCLSIVKEPSAANKFLEFFPKGFIITNLGSAFSSMKNTPKPPTKTSKFIYVPKNKGESSSKGDADLKSMSVHPNCLTIIEKPFATNEVLEFLPKGFIITKKGETPKNYNCSINESSAKDGTT